MVGQVYESDLTDVIFVVMRWANPASGVAIMAH